MNMYIIQVLKVHFRQKKRTKETFSKSSFSLSIHVVGLKISCYGRLPFIAIRQ